MHLTTAFIVFLYNCVSVSVISANCNVGNSNKYDLTLLKREWITVPAAGSTVYKISLCEELPTATSGPNCPVATSVCRVNEANSTAVSVGNYTVEPTFTEGTSSGEFWLTFTGQKCSEDTDRAYRSVINFRCGKTLGSPVILDVNGCDINLEWHSWVACPDIAKDVSEVPCSTHLNGEKYDLTALIKLKGGHSINTANADESLYINVCRDISPDTSTSSCPHGSASYIVKPDATVLGLGHPDGPLETDQDGHLTLTYTTDSEVAGCDARPTTKITFVCPKRGASQPPKLISESACQYIVEWVTEHACPLATLTSNTCILTKEVHDVDIDLSPLTLHAGAGVSMYSLEARNDDGETYTYWLNVCADVGVPCPDNTRTTDIAVCQTKSTDSGFGRSLGRTSQQQLRYADGELTLTYRHGDKCHNDFKRDTVISFHCNKTVDKGQPVFNHDDACSYFFDWHTKYACSSHPEGACQVVHEKKRFDLSPLVREQGAVDWQATDARAGDDGDYFVNVCHDLLLSGASSTCPTDSSVCKKDSSGGVKSLGRYSQLPVYNPVTKSVQVNYTDGAACGTQKIYSIINFRCKPGDLESGPIFVRKSDDGCAYEFDWQTSAACALSRTHGTDCKVFDDDAGFMFDLSKLHLTSGSYNVTSNKYLYMMNVCGPVSGTICDPDDSKNAGVCQVERGNEKNQHHITGAASSELHYYDGLINLTYINGDPYHHVPPVNRSTEIAFLCDPTAGAGHPEFVIESKFTYNFKWYTVYACPEQPVECMFTDDSTHKQYDLTKLSMGEGLRNWDSIYTDESGKHHKFYINVCRPVNPVNVGTGCSAYAGVCEVSIDNGQETIVHTNLGLPADGPRLVSKNHIELHYTSGEECTDSSGEKTTYSTRIEMVCKEGANKGPRFVQIIEKCSYSFIWETSAACAFDRGVTVADEPCMIRDPNTDYVFDLSPLKKTNSSYTVKNSDGRTFKLNICERVLPEDSCDKIDGKAPAAVCEIRDSSKAGIGAVNTKLDYSETGELSLTYNGPRAESGYLTTVVITFICKRDADPGTLRFDSSLGLIYQFIFETVHACPPEIIKCQIEDSQGNQYDLSPLGRADNNWEAIDTRDAYGRYYINVCRPLSTVADSQCAKGPIGGCQVSNSGTSFSLGYVQGTPHAVQNGTITLHYRNGDVCHNGTPLEAKRSLTINFYCSGVEHGPVFSGESPTCEYVFNWRTPRACPIQVIKGNGCRVTEPLYHFTFDLSALRSTAKDYHVTSGDSDFSLNVCGPLAQGDGECAADKKAGACKKALKGDSVTAIGIGNEELLYDNGELRLRYTDGVKNCKGNFNHTTDIIFLCDHGTDGMSGPTFVNESSECSYMFEWKTSHACPPHNDMSCTVTDKNGHQYDLTSLTSETHNYEYIAPTPPQKKYIFNICRSLIHKSGERCPASAGACKIDLEETNDEKKYHSLGEVENGALTVDDNGHLLLMYSNGEVCSDGKTSTTHIRLECLRGVMDTNPSMVLVENNCNYTVIWSSEAACPLSKTDTEAGDCRAKNPSTGHVYDLSSLKSHGLYHVKDTSSNHDYDITVCHELTNSNCGPHTGICQHENGGSKRNFNAGNANSHLKYDDGILVLNYTSGDKCHGGKFERNTLISFVCRHGAGNGEPVFVSETEDCTYHFVWQTDIVCSEMISCSFDNGTHLTDLSALIEPGKNHMAMPMTADDKDPGAAFYLNLCESLNPIQDQLCPPGSGACRVKDGQKPMSLGKQKSAPYSDENTGLITVKYVDGSTCPSNLQFRASARIIFSCQPGISKGVPRLVDITSVCEYVFEWQTNVVCQANRSPASTCIYINQQTGQTFDLSSLKKEGYYEVPSKGGHYRLNPCGEVGAVKESCTASPVCEINPVGRALSFGKISTGRFQMQDGKTLLLKYSGGDDCNSDTSDSLIFFECDVSAGMGTPVVSWKQPCNVAFLWKTAVVCGRDLMPCVLSSNNNIYDLGTLSRYTGNWTTSDNKQNLYWMNVCANLAGGQVIEGCPANAAVCRRSSDGTVLMLGTLESQQLKMSDDGQTLVLRYSDGAPCSTSDVNKKSAVIFKFICSNTHNGPTYVPNADNENQCQYEFIWKTHMACKEKRVQADERNGLITDERAGAKFDLRPLNIGRNHVAQANNDQFLYYLDLEGDLRMSDGTTHACQHAAICEKSFMNGTSYRSLGEFKTRQFYVEDDKLQAEFSTSTVCITATEKVVRSIITFYCRTEENTISEPMLVHQSKDCAYLFEWHTSSVCIKPSVNSVAPTYVVQDSTTIINSSSAGNNILKAITKDKSTIIAVILCSVLIGTLIIAAAIILRSPIRRAKIAVRLRSVFSNKEPSIRYSLLSQHEMDDDSVEPSVSIERSEITIENGTLKSFHDDSDDDDLLE